MKLGVHDSGNMRHSSRFLVVKAMKLQISLHGSFKFKWDVLIIFLALYNCTMTPFLISFTPVLDEQFSVRLISILVDLIFIVDMCMLFITTFFNDQGQEIKNPKEIVIHTLQTNFVVSILSSIPIEFLIIMIPSAENVMILLIIFKMLRFSRLGRIFLVLRMRLVVKLTALLVQLLVLLLVYINIVACSWFYLVNINKTWQPMVAVENIYESPLLEQYLILYYCACYTLLGIELYPTTIYEYIFLNVSLLMGALVNSLLVGEIVGIMKMVNRETQIYNEFHDRVVDNMIKLKVNRKLQSRVLEVIIFASKLEDDMQKYKKMMKLIPPSYKKLVYHKVYSRIFASNNLFRCNPELEHFACLAFRQLFFKPEIVVVRQFEPSDCIYFISSGKFRVFVDNIYVNRIGTGEYFGEIGVIFGCPRTATVVSKNFSTVGCLSAKYIKKFLNRFPDIHSRMLREINTYSDSMSRFVQHTLSKIEYFGKLRQEALNVIRFSLRKEHYKKGSFLFRANSKCMKAFVILSGAVNLQFKVRGLDNVETDIVIEVLRSGSILNSMHVLIQYEHVVNCEVIEDLEVLEYTFDELRELYKKVSYLKMLVYLSSRKMSYQRGKRMEKRVLYLDYQDRKLDFYFKNQVIKTILLRRKFRHFVGMKMLTKRIRAVLLARSFGHKKLAEDIAKGKFPLHIAEGGNILTKYDIENPYCPQIAYELSKANISYEFLYRDMLRLYQISLRNSMHIENLRESISVYSQILDSMIIN